MKPRPPIYTRYYDLLGWIMDRVSKFPKNMRFGIVQTLERIALEMLEVIVEALYRRDRHVLHQVGNLQLEKLRVFLRLSHDRGLLGSDQLRYAIGELDEIGRMWHGWTKEAPREAGGKPV